LNSQKTLKNKYFSKTRFQKDQQYNTTVIDNVNNKTFLNRNLIIHCKITRESTQKSLAFHDEGARITKENKTRVYAIQQCVSFMPSLASIYNLIFFMKLT